MLSKLKKRITAIPKFLIAHKWDVLPILVILVLKVILHGLNFTEYPYYENDEATYSIRALAFANNGSFDIYTYWYDHAPAGWMLLAAWYVLTGEAALFGNLLNSSRFFIFLLSSFSAVFVYLIAKKVIKDRWFALLAAVLFIASPLSIYFQRRVLLDNIMIFWILLALLFVLNKPMRLRDSLISGVAFSFAVLTKLNAIFFAPAFLYAVFVHSPKKIRTMSLALWSSVAGAIMLLFPLFALLKGELFSKNPNPETGSFDNGISLIDSLTYQSSRGTADGLLFWQEGSSFRSALEEWVAKDVTLMTFMLVSLALLAFIFFKRTRDRFSQTIVLMIAMLGMLIFMVRGGVVLEFYFIPIIPFAVIGIAAVLYAPLTLKQVKNKYVRALYKVAIAGSVLALQMPYVLTHQAFSQDETNNMVLAVEWVQENIEPGAYIASDNYAVIFLNAAGDYNRLHYNYKYEYDPDIKNSIGEDWRNIDYILLTHEVLKQIRVGETPFLREAFDHSVEVASFTDHTSSYNDIDNYISTNGDWVKIFKVKKDNEIIRQQSWDTFLDEHLLDYGRIVDDVNTEYTTSQYQSNSMVRALHEGEHNWFDGIWQWTKDHLQNRAQDRLISFEWSKDEDELKVTDPNTNSLSDLEFAYALYNAADKWEMPSYRLEADQILADYWESEVFDFNGRYYILPQKAQTVTVPFTINPSYAAIPYMEYFASQDTEYDWQKLINDSYQMLKDVQDPRTGLFPNWVDIGINGAVSPAIAYAGQSATQFGYEAFRIPYWLYSQSDTNTTAKELLIPYGLYVLNEYSDDGILPAVIETDGTEQSTFDDTLMYGAAYAGLRLVDPELAEQMMLNQVLGSGFDEETGRWAQEGSNIFNQFWLPILINDSPSLQVAAPIPENN